MGRKEGKGKRKKKAFCSVIYSSQTLSFQKGLAQREGGSPGLG